MHRHPGKLSATPPAGGDGRRPAEHRQRSRQDGKQRIYRDCEWARDRCGQHARSHPYAQTLLLPNRSKLAVMRTPRRRRNAGWAGPPGDRHPRRDSSSVRTSRLDRSRSGCRRARYRVFHNQIADRSTRPQVSLHPYQPAAPSRHLASPRFRSHRPDHSGLYRHEMPVVDITPHRPASSRPECRREGQGQLRRRRHQRSPRITRSRRFPGQIQGVSPGTARSILLSTSGQIRQAMSNTFCRFPPGVPSGHAGQQ